MSRKPAQSIAAVLIACLVVLSVPGEALAQSGPANRTSRASSPAKRLVWTLIGAGIGFGAGLMFGVHKFDDAINSDRNVWISALTGAAAGGIAGGILSWDVKPDLVVKPKTPKRNDPLWEGMAAGAAAGAVVGLLVVPAKECKPENPECPTMLRIGVGIPVIAAGAALGALVDRLRER
ncbi:MAG: hypothetical protein WD690_17795 [Vicinamibacterales bacterium]